MKETISTKGRYYKGKFCSSNTHTHSYMCTLCGQKYVFLNYIFNIYMFFFTMGLCQ